MDSIYCMICKHENKGDKYGDCTCEKCGQQYSYTESMRILLDSSQLDLLRGDNKYNKERLAALVRIYRAASVAKDYQLESETVSQLKDEFGLSLPCTPVK